MLGHGVSENLKVLWKDKPISKYCRKEQSFNVSQFLFMHDTDLKHGRPDTA